METPRQTLRRAALVFAGRIPTDAEYAAVRGGDEETLRQTIRGLMTGPGFHEFLIRASNDRLLTDRDAEINLIETQFTDAQNMLYELVAAANAAGNMGEAQFALERFQKGVAYGAARSPLELIAHVVQNDLPYTEILTADYIMANPIAAKAYGASTEFENPNDDYEFQRSRIVSYYRDDESKIAEYDTDVGVDRVIDPGNLATDYPHAGILNTTIFLNRYPSTATNRNRARSRWTYYHFLGVDVEKSASRTTDPVALADTNNPTMLNPACTVCHSVLDPVAGAFQNYGDGGYYRDQWGGLDSLDQYYKNGTTPSRFEIAAENYEARQTLSLQAFLDAGSSLVIEHPHNNGCGDNGHETCGRDLRIEQFVLRDSGGSIVDRIEWSELDADCESDGRYNAAGGTDEHYQWWGWGCTFSVDVPAAATYTIEMTVWADQAGEEVTWFRLGATLYTEGDTWYRDMRAPGFDGELVPDPDGSLQWLGRRIVADPRFAEATVKFWWPAIMGSEVAEPPEDDDDVDFDGRLLASNAQGAEVERLAGGFASGFSGGARVQPERPPD